MHTVKNRPSSLYSANSADRRGESLTPPINAGIRPAGATSLNSPISVVHAAEVKREPATMRPAALCMAIIGLPVPSRYSRTSSLLPLEGKPAFGIVGTDTATGSDCPLEPEQPRNTTSATAVSALDKTIRPAFESRTFEPRVVSLSAMIVPPDAAPLPAVHLIL